MNAGCLLAKARGEGNPLSIPPEDYDRKIKIQNN